MYELRKQPTNDIQGKKIEVVEKSPFKADRWKLLKKARELSQLDHSHYYYIYQNNESKNKGGLK